MREKRKNAGASGEFGVTLRGLRRQRGLTQAALAAQARVAQTYISDLERGTGKQPSGEVVARLAGALDVAVAQLAQGIGADIVERLPERGDAHLAELAGIWPELLPADQEVLLYLARTLRQRRSTDPPGDVCTPDAPFS
jgi:transcriptional regulator with XRE-family HTH domain